MSWVVVAGGLESPRPDHVVEIYRWNGPKCEWSSGSGQRWQRAWYGSGGGGEVVVGTTLRSLGLIVEKQQVVPPYGFET